MKPIRTAFLCLLIAAAITPLPALAGKFESAGTQSSSPAPLIQWEYDQLRPRVAYSTASQVFLAVWEDHHWGFGDDWDIYGRLVAQDGTPIGSAFGIGYEDAKHRRRPDVVYNPNNDEFFVVYEYEYSATDIDIYARRVSSNGTLIGGELQIATTTLWESAPVVAHSTADNTYLIVYEKRPSNDVVTPRDIIGEVRTDVGNLWSGPSVIASNVYDEAAPDVEYSPVSDRFFVVHELATAGPNRRIQGHLLHGDGSIDGSPVEIFPEPGVAYAPRVTYNPLADEFITVMNNQSSMTGMNVAGRIFELSSRTQGNLWGIVTTPEDDLYPAVSFCPVSDRLLIPWEYEYSASDHDVMYCWRHDDFSIQYEAQFLGVSTHTAREGRPDAASDGQLGGLVVWEDERDAATGGVDIWARLINTGVLEGRVYSGEPPYTGSPLAGVLVWLYGSNSAVELGEIVDAAVTGENGEFTLPYVGTKDYYTIFEQDAYQYQSIAARSAFGTVLDENTIQFAAPPLGQSYGENDFWDLSLVSVESGGPVTSKLWMSLPYPNPSRGEVVLDLHRDQARPLHLEVVDVSGRVVRRLEPEPGSDSVIRWDGRLNGGALAPGGIYYLRASDGNTTIVRRFAIVR